MGIITYKEGTNINAEELSQLFISSGIKRPSNDLNRLKRMIENSDIILTAWDDAKLVGIARAITDFCYCCYLSDLAVNKEYQKCGIGGELIRLLQERIGEEVSLLLLASPSAMEYYPKIGFETVENGFKISRIR
ncbi:GNAT family N-acetyltransferase [Lederbergia panacisoli]|uniref:GNAT family N-acetyltransferase n=1 Tax=Lederbergia panacisoli TaxID=1255251 RepID=UPI00214B7736|nr:GNAT family N-acetyltransferase [Lederbergia panacisoli]MCR2822576.1 GNAT family N-acetyltransferase [Lederbergia panacisoli]